MYKQEENSSVIGLSGNAWYKYNSLNLCLFYLQDLKNEKNKNNLTQEYKFGCMSLLSVFQMHLIIELSSMSDF